MLIQREVVTATTDGSGNATVYTNPIQFGRILSITYVAGSSAYDNTVDFTITSEATGESILSRTNVSAGFTNYPRAQTHSVTGVLQSYSDPAGSTPNGDAHLTGEPVAIALDRVKIVVAQGGASKNGTFHIVIG